MSETPDGGTAAAGRDHGQRVRVHVGPDDDPELNARITSAGAELSPLADADAVVWSSSDPARFPTQLPAGVRWVQLPSAGVERWVAAGRLTPDRVWTTAAGAYAESVAEHTVMLLLAGVRQLPAFTAATRWQQEELAPTMRSLRGSTVSIIGCGGIGVACLRILRALGADVIAVTRRGTPVPGAVDTLAADRTQEVWSRSDHVILAAPATADTRHLVGAAELAQLPRHAWVVNIARGGLVDTEALTAALARGDIAGAALDVTDPEPLPAGHALWSEPRAIITPHVANPPQLSRADFLARVTANVQRFQAGRDLLGVFDGDAGY